MEIRRKPAHDTFAYESSHLWYQVICTSCCESNAGNSQTQPKVTCLQSRSQWFLCWWSSDRCRRHEISDTVPMSTLMFSKMPPNGQAVTHLFWNAFQKNSEKQNSYLILINKRTLWRRWAFSGILQAKLFDFDSQANTPRMQRNETSCLKYLKFIILCHG